LSGRITSGNVGVEAFLRQARMTMLEQCPSPRRPRAALWLGLLLAGAGVLLLPAAARAGTVLYYSAPDLGYGWCSEHGSQSATRECARQSCEGAGNSDCRLVLDCGSGWAAVAETDGNSVVAAVCERNSAIHARHHALLLCIAAAAAECWTITAFFGSSETSHADNRAFDQAWYVQVLLAESGYEIGPIDGDLGPRTRRAIRDVQSRAGLAETGTPSPAVLKLLLARFGGMAGFAAAVKREIERRDEASDASTQFVFVHGVKSGAGTSSGGEQRRDKPGG
jgi:hypothetical protein